MKPRTVDSILSGLSDTEKFERLADLFLDAQEWRCEESQLLEKHRQDLMEANQKIRQLSMELNTLALKTALETWEGEALRITEMAHARANKAV